MAERLEGRGSFQEDFLIPYNPRAVGARKRNILIGTEASCPGAMFKEAFKQIGAPGLLGRLGEPMCRGRRWHLKCLYYKYKN